MSRLRKLRAMGPRELVDRLAYRAALAAERHSVRNGHRSSPDTARRRLGAEAAAGGDWRVRLWQERRRHAARFFEPFAGPDDARRDFTLRYPRELHACREDAAEAAAHRFSFFGQSFEYGREIDWHADPVTGAAWPRVFHADVPIHGGDRGFGDVKHVWELNRHQFLLDLGKSFFIDANNAHSADVRAVVLHWMRENPPGVGVNWSCALEPAFRALSWLWAYVFCLDSNAMDAEFHAAWLEGFEQHGQFIDRHLEHYTSPYNHLAIEAAVLFALGQVFKEFGEAARWRSRGRAALEKTLSRQFHADGGSVEQSTFYHHATLGAYLVAAVIGRRNGDGLSPAVWSAIERALEFSMHLMLPDGRTPSIGGADDGKPIRLEHLPLWDFRPYLAIGAALFDRPDFKFAAGRFHEDAFWLLGEPGRIRFERLAAEPPPAKSIALAKSGYVVMRSDWIPEADYLCFDCGEQAAGLRTDRVPSAAHGHADCLSVIVALAGRPVLVDPGFYTYNGPPEWEVHFRKTRAHNTAVLDGRDQARHVSKMDWYEVATATLEHLNAEEAVAVGSHDGFARGPAPVVHRRKVKLNPGGRVVVDDIFDGSGSHEVALTFQFAPGEARMLEGCRVVWEGRYMLEWSSSIGAVADLACGIDGNPDGGWIAPSLGVRVAAPRLRLSFRIEAPASTRIVLSDTERQSES